MSHQIDMANKDRPKDHGGISTQDWLALELDLVVLCKELIRLGNFSGRIADSFRDQRLSEQEQELQI